VPTISDLLHELDTFDPARSTLPPMVAADEEEDAVDPAGVRRIADYKKTSLREHIAIFNRFLAGLDKGNRAARERQRGPWRRAPAASAAAAKCRTNTPRQTAGSRVRGGARSQTRTP